MTLSAAGDSDAVQRNSQHHGVVTLLEVQDNQALTHGRPHQPMTPRRGNTPVRSESHAVS